MMYSLPTHALEASEKFSEFQTAYNALCETETYNRGLEEAIRKQLSNDEMLVVTEGCTDWMHMKAAYERLKDDDRYADIFNGLKFKFWEYPKDECMGDGELVKMCNIFAKAPHEGKAIFIADADVPDTTKQIQVEGKDYKTWKNDVYSFVLPVPEHRKNTPKICIEHYYTDDEIKTPDVINGTSCRLFICNEFDKRGVFKGDESYLWPKSPNSNKNDIEIVDGSSGRKVTKSTEKGDNPTNYALPKYNFAKNVLDHKKGFDKFKVDAFVDIFRILRKIQDECK